MRKPFFPSQLLAHIRHLRQKIEPDPGHPVYFLTVPSVGYTLTRHASQEEQTSAKELKRGLRVVSF